MMQTQLNNSAAHERQIDLATLELLRDAANPRPWSVEEVEREIGSDAVDSLDRLYGAGLIHRVQGFVWTTRAAMRAGVLT